MSLEPGPHLDALIAEKVFGCSPKPGERNLFWCGCSQGHIDPDTYSCGELPKYSADISAAWEVVEYLPKLVERINHATDGPLILIHMEQGYPTDYFIRIELESFSHEASSEISMPHAICLAALKAVGVEVE